MFVAFFCHWYKTPAVPLVETEKVTGLPAQISWEAGGVVMAMGEHVSPIAKSPSIVASGTVRVIVVAPGADTVSGVHVGELYLLPIKLTGVAPASRSAAFQLGATVAPAAEKVSPFSC